jgi:COP9 signalosome complex subunit 1
MRQVIFDHLNYAAIISAREVGVYAALCALATYDRQQLAAVVINNPPFKQFLELEPRLLNALRLFNAGDYERCLTVLEELRPTLLLDMHLAKHVATLYEHIRKRGLVAYCLPYSCADLTVMARAFNTGVEELQTELFQLIVDKKMHVSVWALSYDLCECLHRHASTAKTNNCTRLLLTSDSVHTNER